MYVEKYASILEARARERSLKRWQRAWKIALIEKNNPQWRDLTLIWRSDLRVPAEAKAKPEREPGPRGSANRLEFVALGPGSRYARPGHASYLSRFSGLLLRCLFQKPY
jgi:hypothetical protein